jgi:acyl-CoA thioesterase FadM
VVASGRYVLVCVAQKDFRPVPIPAEVREKIARFLETAPPTGATPPAGFS